MLKFSVKFFLVLFLFGAVAGCATTQKQNNLEMQGLRNQVTALETQLQEKDQEIVSLRDALVRVTEEKATIRRAISTEEAPEAKSRPTMKQIQMALQHAGFNPGPIDGKKGKQTRDAIKAFQKANNLEADGKVGKKTWALLSQSLERRAK